MSCAAPRRAPTRVYLFAEDHPAIRTASTPTPTRATTTNRPMSRFAPTRSPGPSGMNEDHQEVGQERHGGRELEDRLVGGVGDEVLLLGELHAVGDELRPAVEAPGVHRPQAALHVRHELVLGLADDQGQHQERGEHGDDLDRDLKEHRAARPVPGSGSPVRAWVPGPLAGAAAASGRRPGGARLRGRAWGARAVRGLRRVPSRRARA